MLGKILPFGLSDDLERTFGPLLDIAETNGWRRRLVFDMASAGSRIRRQVALDLMMSGVWGCLGFRGFVLRHLPAPAARVVIGMVLRIRHKWVDICFWNALMRSLAFDQLPVDWSKPQFLSIRLPLPERGSDEPSDGLQMWHAIGTYRGSSLVWEQMAEGALVRPWQPDEVAIVECHVTLPVQRARVASQKAMERFVGALLSGLEERGSLHRDL
jgi:hypothetical protein